MNDIPHRTARMSRATWEALLALCHADLQARGKLDEPDDAVGPVPELTDEVLRELKGLGVVNDSGDVDAGWADTMGAHASAPVRGELHARFGDLTGHTRITVVGDRVFLVHQKSATRVGPDGRTEQGTSREVAIAFAGTQGMWQYVAATLPPLEQLRESGTRAGRDPSPGEVLTDADAQAIAGHAFSDLSPLARTLFEDEKASVAMIVEAWPTPARPVERWSKLWAVAGDQLVSVSLGDDGTAELASRAPGDIAAELEWALAGATTRALATAAEGGES